MIGQNRIKSRVEYLLDNETLPQFIIIQGSRGSGKTMVAKWIAERTMSSIEVVSTGTQAIKDLVEDAYSTTSELKTYIIKDADMMRAEGANALLKISEEPPENVRIIMTYTSGEYILPTIKSRALHFVMDVYTREELQEYIKGTDIDEKVLNVAETIGDIEILKEYDMGKFLSSVESVVDNIATVSGANAFKVGNMVALKNDDKGYDLTVFLKAFMKKCESRVFNSVDDEVERMMYARAMLVASKYISELNIKSTNKQHVMDMFILDIRKVWM